MQSPWRATLPFAGAVHVERSPADVDRAANLRETVSVLVGFGLFVRGSRESEEKQSDRRSLHEASAFGLAVR
jgi:hypothetical protein